MAPAGANAIPRRKEPFHGKNDPLPLVYGVQFPKRVLFAVRAVHRPEEGWRCILIKGGPGTGKSTLMKRVIKLALQRGQPVEEIHCSSDAASLDGVILPRQKTVLLDATPPHALEPQFPGAVEQPFSLCGCWDEELLFTRREEIVRLGREISGLHWQAVRYLSGAGALLGEVRRLAAETLNWEKSSTMCSGWLPGSCLTGANRAARRCGCSPR